MRFGAGRERTVGAAAQRPEHPVQELDVGVVGVQDRLRAAGGARGPHHEGRPVVVPLRAVEEPDAVPGDDRRGRGGIEHGGDLGRGMARIQRDVDAPGQPDTGHGRHDLGTVRELHRDTAAAARIAESIAELGRDATGVGPGRSGRDGTVDRVQEQLVIRTRMIEEERREVHDPGARRGSRRAGPLRELLRRAGHVLPRSVGPRVGFSGQAEHSFADDVLVHLGGPALDGVRADRSMPFTSSGMLSA